MRLYGIELETSPDVQVARLGFLSHDGVTQIKALLWTPKRVASTPKGIVQILHGMEEHIGRYVDFANVLAEQGYVVCAHDMIGHGRSVSEATELSCIPLKGGKTLLVEDAQELRLMTAARYARQTPYFMFGHSMGSYLLRAYLVRYGEGLSGAIFCGAGAVPPLVSRAGNLLARFIAQIKGEDFRSSFLDDRGVGAYAKCIKDARTRFDWLCTDEKVVNDYLADPLCGVPFSAGAYATLTDLTTEANTRENARNTPKKLPLLFIAGSLDPIGDEGKGVVQSANSLKAAGVESVEVKLYDNMRHEIINEPLKKEVYDDVLRWLEEVKSKQ